MGQEEERDQRLLDLERFRLDGELLAVASREAVAMHCLPAHVGEEISEDVLYGASLARVGPGREPPAHPEGGHGSGDPLRDRRIPANDCYSRRDVVSGRGVRA